MDIVWGLIVVIIVMELDIGVYIIVVLCVQCVLGCSMRYMCDVCDGC